MAKKRKQAKQNPTAVDAVDDVDVKNSETTPQRLSKKQRKQAHLNRRQEIKKSPPPPTNKNDRDDPNSVSVAASSKQKKASTATKTAAAASASTKKPPLAHKLLENKIGGWFEADSSGSLEDGERRKSEIKLGRKTLGIKVSVRSVIETDSPLVSKERSSSSGHMDIRHEDIPFTSNLCPPPLPRDIFQLLANQHEEEATTSTPAEQKTEKCRIQLPPLIHEMYKHSKSTLTTPTPIQLQSWPLLLTGKVNMLGIAPTGSGKTLAFSAPMVQICINSITKAYQEKSLRCKVTGGPLGLILSPTRELAQQIGQSIKKLLVKPANRILYQEQQRFKPRMTKQQLGISPKINVMSIFGGGDSRETQIERFQDGEPMVHIIAATPGRLLDLIGGMPDKEENSIKNNNPKLEPLSLMNVSFLVIDEADKMLQMGFREQIDAISQRMRKDRLTALFSATFPQRLGEVCHEWIGGGIGGDHDEPQRPAILVKASIMTLGQAHEISAPSAKEKSDETNVTGAGTTNTSGEKVDVSKPELSTEKSTASSSSRMTDISAIPSHIAQILHVCATHKKPKKLMTTLAKIRKVEEEQDRKRNRQGLLIIFFAKIKTLKFVWKLLQEEGVKCKEFHGQLRQQDREKTLGDFKAGKVCIILATDIAARGIHINNITNVINYDFPSSVEQYVHRCGRAARNYDPKKATSDKPAACVYSFFTRQFKPMARDMIALLKASNAWVDNNLVELLSESSTSADQQDNKKREQKSKRESPVVVKAAKSPKEDSGVEGNTVDSDDAMDIDDGDFSKLLGNRIMLKRADYVSDADDSSVNDADDSSVSDADDSSVSDSDDSSSSSI